MGDQPVTVEFKERVGMLTLNQPDSSNTMNDRMAKGFHSTILALREDA